jgi:hypothetical protein
VTAPARGARRAPAWDAPITVALLVSGVWQVTTTVAAARTLSERIASIYSVQGIGTYTSTALAAGVGWAISAESMLLLVAAIGLAVPRLRQHRRAVWIPLAAAAANVLLTVLLVVIAFVGDPAFAAAFGRG